MKSPALAAAILTCLPFAAAQDPTAESALFQTMPVVEAATLHVQTLQEAPANVTIITADEIHKYGYRTLAEALSSVRGFYVTNDRIYQYVGVRGFSLPGDLNTRFLVMLNGHPLTEIAYESNNFFGQDFGLDMDLVDRIEIIRGPTSALYGSDGIFANVNVVTRSPVDSAKWRISTENGSFGQKKAEASGSIYLGKGANLLVSGSIFNDAGQDLCFPSVDGQSADAGCLHGSDGQRGFHTFANLVWRNWTFTAYFDSRQVKPPIGWDNAAIFGDPGAHVQDERGLIGATYTHDIGSKGKLRWSTYFDQYHYDQRLDYQDGDRIRDLRQTAAADWIDSQLTYSFETGRSGRLTVGLTGSYELRNAQHNFQVAPSYMDEFYVNKPDRQAAVFAQEEFQIAPKWKAYVGLRFDVSKNFNNDLSPRAALVYEQNSKNTWKFVYGRPFRNPSVYEQFFQDGLSLIQAPNLRPETAQTFEISYERQLRRDWRVVATAYDYRLSDLIAVVYPPSGDPPGQYQNAAHARVRGFEGEFKGQLWKRAELSVSAAFQWDGFTDGAYSQLPDSPRAVHKIRVGVPLMHGKLFGTFAASYLSPRLTSSNAQLGSVFLSDCGVSTVRLNRDFDLVAGVRNAFNLSYSDPIGLGIDQMPQNGRSLFLKLIWHARE